MKTIREYSAICNYCNGKKQIIPAGATGTCPWETCPVCKGEGSIIIRETIIDNDRKNEYPESGGWECPRCHKIHSWLDMECDCPPESYTFTTYKGT